MDNDERKWVEEALTLCERANEKKVTVMFVRSTGEPEDANIVVTNAINDHAALALAAQGVGGDGDE